MECFCISSTTPAERVDREITREIEIKRKVYESTYRLLLLGKLNYCVLFVHVQILKKKYYVL